jgi:hypothetical protein
MIEGAVSQSDLYGSALTDGAVVNRLPLHTSSGVVLAPVRRTNARKPFSLSIFRQTTEETVPLKSNYSTLLFSLTLCSVVQAAPSAETEATFQHALRIAEDNKQQIDLLVEREQQGKIDKLERNEVMQKLAKNNEIFESELRKASEEGHGVASYLLASTKARRKDSAVMHAEACELYQRSTDQGLLAGAVLQLRECDKAFRTYKYDAPESLRLRAQLQRALEQSDPYSDHYPLPTLNSYCFKTASVPQVNNQKPLTTLRGLYTPVFLSLDQFRADGYYLLAVMGGDIGSSAARGYFKKVQDKAPDCLDPVNIKIMYEQSDLKNH